MNFGFYASGFSPGNTTDDPPGHSATPGGRAPHPVAHLSSLPQPYQFATQSITSAGHYADSPLRTAEPGQPKDTTGGSSRPIGMACRACRQRKIRCGGERPRCMYCVKKGYECLLTPHKKRGRPRKNTDDQGGKLLSGTRDDIGSEETPYVDEDMDEGEGASFNDNGAPVDLGKGFADGMLDLRQLWMELTGGHASELPLELSALAANSATQMDELLGRIPSIGPSFNLGGTVPGPGTGQDSSGGDLNILAANYAFPPFDPMTPVDQLSAGLTARTERLASGYVAADAGISQQQLQNMHQIQMPFAMPSAQNQNQNQNQNLEQSTRQNQRMSQRRGASVGSSTHLSFGTESIAESAKESAVLGIGESKRIPVGSASQNQNNHQNQHNQIHASVVVAHTIDEGIRQYFSCVHPWMPILHRPTFEKQVLCGQVDPILYYAVQAISARFCQHQNQNQNQNQHSSPLQSPSTSASVSPRRPYKRGHRFARAAQSLLPESLKCTKLSTLQAITILALYMSVSGHWQEGAAHEKLAVQLAFTGQYHLLDEEFLIPPVTNNMGLFESGWSERTNPSRLEALSRPGGILEHEQRRRLWWAIFHLERFNGLAMGRPAIIKPGWHWVWLPCSDELWASDQPSGTLSWELGLTAVERRPSQAVSNYRVDLVLALIMGQLVEQRTEMFRLFFPRIDRGTLFYDNLPTHSLQWSQRLRSLAEVVHGLERRIRQWRLDLDQYADAFSTRRHANFEIIGASCLVHLYACVLQIREHLFEDMLVHEEAQQGSGGGGEAMDDLNMAGVGVFSQSSSAECMPPMPPPPLFEGLEGVSNGCANSWRSTYQRGYVARAKRPKLTLQFVGDLDSLAQRCWDRSVAAADETAGLLHAHWLKPLDHQAGVGVSEKADMRDDHLESFVSGSFTHPRAADSKWTLGASQPKLAAHSKGPPVATATASASASASAGPAYMQGLDARIADRFKLMSPQTPYHLFIAGKVQAARLKQAISFQASAPGHSSAAAAAAVVEDEGENGGAKSEEREAVVEAIRRVNQIWDAHGAGIDAQAVEARLDLIVVALEYCQLYWYSLNFASHLKYLKREAMKAGD
ncbi:fungal-specific transcription factor domain-containing protein [Kickxella alabastrina]|uniref:fungal-specific transcription factor domain-containing protein n=1 Tax=Kickxella alabastrina TaxID=61397 RepID=UPI00221F80C0|nr:fungal-specific transcription factor domain-containing protein [Kickxella alabastrina]KAI7831062.1 fungal-specific transcription factor domain-containing protein [Kickxella alabastrina]